MIAFPTGIQPLPRQAVQQRKPSDRCYRYVPIITYGDDGDAG